MTRRQQASADDAARAALETSIVAQLKDGETPQLTEEQQQLVGEDPNSFAQGIRDQMRSTIDQESANQLGLTLPRYYQYAADVHNGVNATTAYDRQLAQTAAQQGFTSLDNYLTMQNGTDEEKAQVLQAQYAHASQIAAQQDAARSAGLHTIDELQFVGNMDRWTPKQSQILMAHEMGLTNQQYIDQMHLLAHHQADQARDVTSLYTPQQVLAQRKDDDYNFQSDLLAAGYSLDDYATTNETGDVIGMLQTDDPETTDYSQIEGMQRENNTPV